MMSPLSVSISTLVQHERRRGNVEFHKYRISDELCIARHLLFSLTRQAASITVQTRCQALPALGPTLSGWWLWWWWWEAFPPHRLPKLFFFLSSVRFLTPNTAGGFFFFTDSRSSLLLSSRGENGVGKRVLPRNKRAAVKT